VDILDDMGASKLSAKVFFFLKVNYSFNQDLIRIVYVEDWLKTTSSKII